MRSKNYREIKEKVSAEAVDIETAVAFLKKRSSAKFDETVEVHVRLGVDPEKSEQKVRGSVVLPHGTPKKKRIAVFVSDKVKQKRVKDAGAAIVGGEDLIVDIEGSGSLDADVAVATPDMMPKIANIARIIGPKGLMPNPKTGTVTPDVEKVVQELHSGKISFKMDQLGNIHEVVGKVSWDTERLVENIHALLEEIRAVRPQAQAGEYIEAVTISSTMSPGVQVKDS